MVVALSLQPGNIVAWVLVGLIAGALAGRLARGRGYGYLGDVVLGLLGALVGGFIVSLFVKGSAPSGFFETTGIALLGALILIFVVRAVTGTLR